MELIYQDESLIVCVKPAGVVSTDSPGGVPELAREALGLPEACIRTVHRLDQAVSGLMVLCRSPQAAAALSAQIREHQFEKEYLAVVHGAPEPPEGTMEDLLYRDRARRMTFVAREPGKGVQEALLSYRTLCRAQGKTRVAIRLHTGRTHQIRVQFSSRGMPLFGERKYGTPEDGCPLALWSYRVAFFHPATGKWMDFTKEPPAIAPWTEV